MKKKRKSQRSAPAAESALDSIPLKKPGLPTDLQTPGLPPLRSRKEKK